MEAYKISNRRYLGSKTRLLPLIDQVVTENCKGATSFFDVFGGTGVVGSYFNNRFSLIENDFLFSNYVAFEAFLGNEEVNELKLNTYISAWNETVPLVENYYSENFSDTYLSRENMAKVGFIRDTIDAFHSKGEINNREKAILITSLLYAIDHIANTVGHYDAYRKNGNLDRELILKPLVFSDVDNRGNQLYQEDSNELARKVSADIAYIDPPYNSRQYSDAYHFLENVACNEKPEVVGVARKMDRSALKSKYNTKSAPKAFDDLIENLNVKYILVSYNNIGEKGNSRSNAKISDEEILASLKKRGRVKIYEQEFNSFTTGKTKLEDHKERIFLCCVGETEPSDTLEEECTRSQSPLNYTGGKYKILPQLEDKFPENIGTFVDVFCGGCNVGSNVLAEKIICIDKEPHLVELLNYLKSHTFSEVNEALLEKIDEYGLSNTSEYGYANYGCNSSSGVGSYNKEKYLKLRDDYNRMGKKDPLLFLLLIMFSFNNQIRFNGKGEFNLPVGKRDYNKVLRKKLRLFMANLHGKDISFICSDFEKLPLEELPAESSFVYLDPPYSLGLASYNENGLWSETEDERLFVFLDKLNEKGIRFGLSNVMEHKGVKNEKLLQWCLEKRYNINYLYRSYSNASYHVSDRNAKTEEVLITNY